VAVPPGKIARTARLRGIGVEAAARLYRHRAWNREARRLGAVPPADGPARKAPSPYILVAHTLDDLLETALMGVLRGAGPAGLAAMPPRRGRIIRPLLTLGRAEVFAYLEERRISYRTDLSNGDNRFLRNRVRNVLVPCLAGLYPSYRRTLLSMAETQALSASFLTAEARRRCPWESVPDGERIILRTEREPFFSQPEIIREEALFQGLDLLGAGRPRYRRTVIRLFCGGKTARVNLGGVELLSEGAHVLLVPGGVRNFEEGFSLLIKAPGSYTLRGVTFELRRAGSAGHDYEGAGVFFASLPLCIRPSFPEDSLGDGLAVEDAPGGSGRTRPRDFGGRRRVLTAADADGPAAFLSFRRKAGGTGEITVLRGRKTGNGPFSLTVCGV
jgi:tRNA(Ile)-lysidine synthase